VGTKYADKIKLRIVEGYYLNGWCEKLGDCSLQFVGQRQLEDARLINESLLNPSSTQQLK